MGNDISASFPKYWSRRMQRKHYKVDRYRTFVSMEEQDTLKKGTVVDRPYRSSLVVNDLGSEGSFTRQTISDTSATLTINKEKEVSFYIREIDEIQSNYESRNKYADDSGVKLSNQIDGDVFGEYDQATSDVDAGDIEGGTAAKGFVVTINNVMNVWVKAGEKLDALSIFEEADIKGGKIPQNQRKAYISPQLKSLLIQFLGGKDSALGDSSGVNGHIGKYGSFELFLTNSLGWSARLEFGTLPIDGDKVVINGVTYTFKDSIGTTAGNVHIGASTAAVALDNLVTSINAPGTSVTEVAANVGFVALSAANQALMKNITATDGATYMTLKATGLSYVSVSETLTAVADIWTANLQIQHNLFVAGNPVDLVIQKYPNVKIKERDGYIGVDVVSWTVYGIKTFSEGADQMVDVLVRTDAF